MDSEVVVVGAGFSGLTVARRLAEAGRRVVVLEARDRVGGRTETIDVEGTMVDVGGQWVGPGQDLLYALADDVGVPTFPQHQAGDGIVLRGGTAIRSGGSVDAFSAAGLNDYVTAVALLEESASTVPVAAPWRAPAAEALDAETLATWMARHVANDEARDLLRLTVQAVFATEPANLSLLHCLAYIASAGSWSRLTDTDGGAQQDRFVGGTRAVADGLRGLVEAAGGEVALSSPVRALHQDDDGITAVADDRSLRAARVVVAVPPALAARIAYDPPLPAGRDQLTQRMPAGSVIKFHVVYDQPWWRDEGLSGQVLAIGERIDVTFDGSPPDESRGIITGFFEGAEAIAVEGLGEAGRRDCVVEVLTRALGPQASSPVAYVERSWSAEPWTRGCYGAHLPPGAWTQLGPWLRPPCGRIHWAGTETADRWAGYIEGAIDSGERVAREVLAILGAG
jgi:monoamine oxidase